MRLVCLLAAWCALTPLAGYAQKSAPADATPAPATPTAAPAFSAAPTPSSRQVRKAEEFYAQAVRAMEKGDVDEAEKAFAKAAKADPTNHDYAVDLEIARQHSVAKLIQDANKAKMTGHAEVARAKLAEALTLDPKNQDVAQHIDDLANLAVP